VWAKGNQEACACTVTRFPAFVELQRIFTTVTLEWNGQYHQLRPRFVTNVLTVGTAVSKKPGGGTHTSPGEPGEENSGTFSV
jgi:hypothetical protein